MSPVALWLDEICRRLRNNDDSIQAVCPPCPIGDYGMMMIANALVNNHVVDSLDLMRPKLGPKGLDRLTQLIRTHPTLRKIRIHGIRLRSDDNMQQQQPQHGKSSTSDNHNSLLEAMLLSSISEATTAGSGGLKVLELSGAIIQEGAACVLRKVLTHEHCPLEELCLINCQLEPLAKKELILGLLENSSLSLLRLVSCHISNSFCVALAAAVGHHPKLQQLDLNENDIGDFGCCVLIESLLANDNATLHRLVLNGNRIGVEGAGHLGQRLPQLRGLQEIGLDANPIKHVSGLLSLRDGVRENLILSKVGLGLEVRQLNVAAAKEMDFLLFLNRIGCRRSMLRDELPLPLWSYALNRLSATNTMDSCCSCTGFSAVNYFLQQRPDLLRDILVIPPV